MILSSVIDRGLSDFLNRQKERVARFDDALVIVTSDHGLHYGPNFPSWQGQKEATEPILYMHIPKEPNVKVDLDVLKTKDDQNQPHLDNSSISNSMYKQVGNLS